jgi:hypothetical protein
MQYNIILFSNLALSCSAEPTMIHIRRTSPGYIFYFYLVKNISGVGLCSSSSQINEHNYSGCLRTFFCAGQFLGAGQFLLHVEYFGTQQGQGHPVYKFENSQLALRANTRGSRDTAHLAEQLRFGYKLLNLSNNSTSTHARIFSFQRLILPKDNSTSTKLNKILQFLFLSS